MRLIKFMQVRDPFENRPVYVNTQYVAYIFEPLPQAVPVTTLVLAALEGDENDHASLTVIGDVSSVANILQA